MKNRSITGPVLLVVIGLLFLVNNLWPEVSLWSLAWNYWPLLLILIGVIGLVEALYQAARGIPNPPRPLAGAGVFWIVIVITFFNWAGTDRNFRFLSFSPGGIHFLGTEYTYQVNQTGVATGVTRLVLDNLHGSLALRGGDSGEVKVAGHKIVRAFSRTDADRADQQSPIRITRDGDRLIISSDESGTSNTLSISAELEITVPRGVEVEASGHNGRLTMDDISGTVDITGRGDIQLTNIAKDVRIDSSHGEIRATDLKGRLDVKGSGSDVQIENVADEVTVHGEYGGTLEFQGIAKQFHFTSNASDLLIAAIPGRVTLDSGDLKMNNLVGPVHFKTGTRDVDVTDVTNSLEIAIRRGDIEVSQTKLPLPKMDVHSQSGDVSLAVPENAQFILDGRTGHGDVSNDYGDPLESDQQGRAATIKGKVGTAGPEVRIGTDRGSVTVKKN
jgi:DUF4097 and DUF4098 domain-containing protein YvlB